MTSYSSIYIGEDDQIYNISSSYVTGSRQLNQEPLILRDYTHKLREILFT